MNPSSAWRTALHGLWAQLNWFRIHLLSFTFIPILFSGFFMAANPSIASGQYRTAYIDALFMCYSAMTVCGLNVLSLSALQPAQQAFLYFLMLIGDVSVVNLLTILCRQQWFRIKGRRIVDSTLLRDLHRGQRQIQSGGENSEPEIQTDGPDPKVDRRERDVGEEARQRRSSVGHERPGQKQRRRSSLSSLLTLHMISPFDEGLRRRHELRGKNGSHFSGKATDPHGRIPHASSGRSRHTGRGGFPSVQTILYRLVKRFSPQTSSYLNNLIRTQHHESVHHSISFKHIGEALEKPLSKHQDHVEKRKAKHVRWLPPGIRDVVVGRNSQFFEEELDDDELELLGTLEYRATNVLTVLLVVHQLFWILVPSAIISIYFAKVRTWDSVFVGNGSSQTATVNRTWFTFFQSASAYSSCGFSLVDMLMVPFQSCYLLIYVMIFPMLAGNQLLPLFLRAEIWLFSKMVAHGSEMEVSLHFILTHSRRLFLYLFPAYQSWWLISIEMTLMITGTVGFIVFNVGLPYYNSLVSDWDKFSVAFFEGVASRASGFGIVTLSNLGPATNFLYLILIFTCNYPLVMALRSTNVYEERALGLHGEHAPKQHNQQPQQAKGEIFSKYLKHHLLPQIYFDLWPIALCTMLILAIERGRMMADDNRSWIDPFRVLFEVTSAYGTVGLSYGNPYNTSSMSASFRKLSKLLVMLLMLRGRHRGLPLAIDRAIMFPIEYLRFSPEERERVERERIAEAGEQAENE